MPTLTATPASVYRAVDHPLVAGVMSVAGTFAGEHRPNMGFEYLSPSQIKTYKRCMGQYWLKYGLGLKEQTNSSLVRGSAIHAAQHAFFIALAGRVLDDTIDPVDAAIKAARDYLRANPVQVYSPRYKKGPLDTWESLDDDLVEAITLLVDHWWKLKVKAAEQGYVIFWRDDNVLPVLGYSDMIVEAETAGEHATVDTKTSTAAKSPRDVEFDVAIPIYAAGHELFTGVRTRESKYLMYCFTKERKVLWIDGPRFGGPDDLTRIFTIVKGLTQARAAGIYPAIPDPAICGSCTLIVPCDQTYGKIGIADRSIGVSEDTEAA